MNLHFLSFIVDVFSWLLLGLYFGHLVHTIEYKHKKENTLCYPIMVLVALCSGIFATLVRALPAHGFALDIFLMAFVMTALFAFAVYKNFRHDVFNERRWTF